MSSSYLDLNNEGVRHLSDGEYEEAAKLFHKAFNILKGTITRRAREARALRVEMTMFSEATADGETTPLGLGRDRTTYAAGAASSAAETGGDSTGEEEECGRNQCSATRTTKRKIIQEEDRVTPGEACKNCHHNDSSSRKRQRIEACAGRCWAEVENRADTSFDETLCRPLWLEPARHRCRGALVAFAASILYNYAYTLHRMGMERTQCHVSPTECSRGVYLRRQAMSVYSKVFRLCGKRRCPVVQWMCCHNLQRLVRVELGQPLDNDTATKLEQRFQFLETHKVLILRALFSPGGGCVDRLFLSVLSLLAIGGNEQTDSPAAAA